jgi:uncharacterized SAM-binding protein YcdF (DUF218 family)
MTSSALGEVRAVIPATPRLVVGERLFPVQVTVLADHTRRFVLEFGQTDLRRVRGPMARDGGLRIEVDGALLGAVRAGYASGTETVMSGRARAAGTWSSVTRAAAGATAGPFFQAWCQAMSTVPASDAVVPGDGPPLIAVLGSTNDEDGRLSPMAVDRLLAAAELVRADPAARLVLTGGFGSHSNPAPLPHWQYAVRFLERQGIPRETVLAVVNSRHTYEDILLLRAVVRSRLPAGVTVVTSEFHATRVRCVLDLVLPAGRVHAVRSRAVPSARLAGLRRHDLEASGKTIVAAALFGPDRLRGEAVPADLGWTTCWTAL